MVVKSFWKISLFLVVDVSLRDMHIGRQDEQALKKQIEELRRTKEALLFQRDNNRRRGQYVLDTIYEENQQMLRQLDDLRSEYEIFAESTKNMQELFASRELVLRTVFIQSMNEISKVPFQINITMSVASWHSY